MSRFKKALDYLSENCYEFDLDEDTNGDLVDIYSRAGEEETKILQEALNELELYKKAFKLACIELSTTSIFCPKENKTFNINDCGACVKKCKLEWEKYFMKGVKNEIKRSSKSNVER